jgi:hypothetical protein
MSSANYNPAQAVNYSYGQLVYYNNMLYVVNKDDPAGTPGTPGSDYVAVGGNGSAGTVGPTGPTGPAGAVSGAQVVIGTTPAQNYSANSNAPAEVNCPAGYIATGGGSSAMTSSGTVEPSTNIAASLPIYSGTPSVPTGWRTIVNFTQNLQNVSITSYAVCIPGA